MDINNKTNETNNDFFFSRIKKNQQNELITVTLKEFFPTIDRYTTEQTTMKQHYVVANGKKQINILANSPRLCVIGQQKNFGI